MDVLCDLCNAYTNIIIIKRNKNSLIESPSRKRPFNSISQIDQNDSFEELRHEKMVEPSYRRLIERFAEKYTDLKLLDNSIPHMKIKTACSNIKDNWNEGKKELLHMIISI